MKTRNLSVVATIVFLLSSCTNEESSPIVNDGQVKFESSAVSVQTKVGGDDGDLWETNDSIGIYMIEHGKSLSESTIKENANNVMYTTTSNGKKGSFTSTTPIYYPVNSSPVDFKAYHPYSNSAISSEFYYVLDVLDQSDQSAIDLMMASANNKGNGYNKYNTSAVELNFNHLLVKVIINVTAGDGINTLSGLKVKVKGMHHKVYFSLENSSLIDTAHEGNPEITPYDAGNNSYELILPPTGNYNLSNCTVEFIVAGDTYVWEITENSGNIEEFESGKKYTFEITLKKKGLRSSGSISSWHDNYLSVREIKMP